MARASKSGAASAGTPSVPPGPSLFEQTFRPAMLFRIALVAGACALWPYAVQKLPSLDKRSEYKLEFSGIQVSPVPERPVPGNLLEQVRARTDLPRELSILDDHLTSDLAEAFRSHPWVANVVRVQKSFPAAVTVELEYRVPVAMVQVSGGHIPIDVDGVVLPTTDFSNADANGFPLIQTVAPRAKIRPGVVWNDPALIAAARLAKLLGERWKSLKLEAIVIRQGTAAATTPNDVLLELTGRGGSKIVWGRAPGTDHPGELEPTQKLRRMEKYLADFGEYGLPNGPYEIDIRHWQEISRRPLASDQSQAKPVKTRKEEARHHNSESKKKTRI